MRYIALFVGVPVLFLFLMGIGFGIYLSLGIAMIAAYIINRGF